MRRGAAVLEKRAAQPHFSQVVTADIGVQALKEQLFGTKNNCNTHFLIAARSLHNAKQVTDHCPITQNHSVRFAHANDTRNPLSF